MSTYPSLSDTLNQISLPLSSFDFSLGDINELQTFTDEILVKEFSPYFREDGSFANYHLRLDGGITGISLSIPGLEGFAIVVGAPSPTGVDTGFDVDFMLEWRFISVLNLLSPEEFSFSLGSFFNLFLKAGNLSHITLLDSIVKSVTIGRDKNTFLKHFNQVLSSNYLPDGFGPDETFEESMNRLCMDIEDKNEILGVVEVIFVYFLARFPDVDTLKREIIELFRPFLGFQPYELIKELLIPRFGLSSKLSLAFKVPKRILKDVSTQDDLLIPFSDVNFVYRSGSNGFTNFDILGSFSVPECKIFGSDISLSITKAKLSLNSKSSPDASIPLGFVGVLLEECSLALPLDLFGGPALSSSSGKIIGTNVLAGTGGLSGSFTLKAIDGVSPDPKIKFALGGFDLEINIFNFSLRQNQIESSSIKGKIYVAFGSQGKKEIPIEIGLKVKNEVTEFLISGDFTSANVDFEIPQALKLKLLSLQLSKEGQVYFARVGGSLDFLFSSDISTTLKKIPVQLRIGSNGSFSFDGGKLVLPTTIKLNLPPVKMVVSGLTLGTEKRNNREYAFIGFDGSIALNPGSNRIDGKGIRIYFTIDGNPPDFFIYMQSLAIELQIPGNVSPDKAALIIKGFLEMPATPGDDYAGSLAFQLPRMSIAGGAAARFNTKFPAMIVDANVDLPTGIPLGGSGISLFGFRGLFGTNYKVNKTASEKWYQWYSKGTFGLQKPKVQHTKNKRTLMYTSKIAGSAARRFPNRIKLADYSSF